MDQPTLFDPAKVSLRQRPPVAGLADSARAYTGGSWDGEDLARAAVGEHQRRFGQGALPTASKTLSPDSAGLVTKIMGSRAKVEWGDPGEATGRREQDRWARTQVEGADEHLQNPNREKFPVQLTDALDQATARPSGPPPAPPAPYQRGWTPGQERLF